GLDGDAGAQYGIAHGGAGLHADPVPQQAALDGRPRTDAAPGAEDGRGRDRGVRRDFAALAAHDAVRLAFGQFEVDEPQRLGVPDVAPVAVLPVADNRTLLLAQPREERVLYAVEGRGIHLREESRLEEPGP